MSEQLYEDKKKKPTTISGIGKELFLIVISGIFVGIVILFVISFLINLWPDYCPDETKWQQKGDFCYSKFRIPWEQQIGITVLPGDTLNQTGVLRADLGGLVNYRGQCEIIRWRLDDLNRTLIRSVIGNFSTLEELDNGDLHNPTNRIFQGVIHHNYSLQVMKKLWDAEEVERLGCANFTEAGGFVR